MTNLDEHIDNLDNLIKEREQVNKDVTTIINTGFDKIQHNNEFMLNSLLITSSIIMIILVVMLALLLSLKRSYNARR